MLLMLHDMSTRPTASSDVRRSTRPRKLPKAFDFSLYKKRRPHEDPIEPVQKLQLEHARLTCNDKLACSVLQFPLPKAVRRADAM